MSVGRELCTDPTLNRRGIGEVGGVIDEGILHAGLRKEIGFNLDKDGSIKHPREKRSRFAIMLEIEGGALE